jgi:hypothetical protein
LSLVTVLDFIEVSGAISRVKMSSLPVELFGFAKAVTSLFKVSISARSTT